MASGESEERPAQACIGLEAVTVSPGGARAVVFVALDDGEVLGSYRFAVAAPCPMVGDDPCATSRPEAGYRGLTWIDGDHLDLVQEVPPASEVRAPGPGGPGVDPEQLRTVLLEVGAP